MAISLKPEHLKRYKDIGLLFMKYGRSDLVKTAGLEEAFADDEVTVSEGAAAEADQLALDLERLGPTYIKLGQLLSTRGDLLPPPYLDALARLQDNVEPFSFAEVEETIQKELGVRLSKAFSEFESIPLAAASLGQVHRARLRDGRSVVVKVQRPAIRELMFADLEAFAQMAEFLDKRTEAGERYEFGRILEELRKSLMRELDYRQEARNLLVFAENLEEFEGIVVPAPIEDFTTSRVLTMEQIEGTKITELSPLAHMEIDGEELAEHLFRAYLQQILVDGFFHADPHPGNVFLTDDGRIALIDLGMVGRVSSQFQEDLLQLLLAISEGKGEEATRITIKIGEPKTGFMVDEFRRHISDLIVRHQDAQIERINAGQVVLEITRIAAEYGFRLPVEFTMIAKALLNLDQVALTLDPHFDVNASIRRNAAEIMQQRILKSLSPGNFFNSALELKNFVERLPSRLNRLVDTFANNELEIRVNAIDEHKLMEGFQKIANRITMGLVLAALIVGAALMLRVQTDFTILGYPGLAVICFFAAAAGGVALILEIVLHDRKYRK